MILNAVRMSLQVFWKKNKSNIQCVKGVLILQYDSF